MEGGERQGTRRGREAGGGQISLRGKASQPYCSVKSIYPYREVRGLGGKADQPRLRAAAVSMLGKYTFLLTPFVEEIISRKLRNDADISAGLVSEKAIKPDTAS